MRWRRVVFGVVLLTSVGANAWMLLVPPAQPTTRPPSRSRTHASPRPARHEPVDHPRSSGAIPADIAALDRDALEHQLADAEAKLDKLLPAEERFELDERTPETEVAMRKILDPLFDVPDDYQLECHRMLCRIESRQHNDWSNRIQTDMSIVGKIHGASFSGDVVFAYLEDPAAAAAINLVTNLFYSLHESPAVAACKQANPTPGVVWFVIHFDPATRTLSATAGGSLAEQAGGICIRKVLEDLIAKTPVPKGLTAIPEGPFPIEVP